MLMIIAKNCPKMENMDKFIELSKELVELSQKEEGCIKYTLNRNNDIENEFIFLEMWKDKDAADFHMNTEHFKRLVPAIGELLEEGEARFYSEVSF